MQSLTSILTPADREPLPAKKTPAITDRSFLGGLLQSSLVLVEEWQKLPGDMQADLSACQDAERVLTVLVEHRLLTEYQADRIRAGTTYGLVLGNYRILGRLGAGGMAVVF